MLFKTRTGAVYGIEARPVEVEVNISPGGNGDFKIVGLPDSAIRESRPRIRAAVRNSGFEFPVQYITINLAPANLRKEGSAFDLSMAVGILGGTRLIHNDVSNCLFIGELSLDGRLRPVRGALSMAMLARDSAIERLILPEANAKEAAVVEGVSVYPVRTLAEVVDLVNGNGPTKPFRVSVTDHCDPSHSRVENYQDVRGQQHAKRAIEVAGAGGHNILMMGPPGSGKTMLARRIPSVIPPMTFEESLETTRIHSNASLLPNGNGLVEERPFRAPHHSVSAAGLIGGGSIPRPGEVSLAHSGVLFLDELPEFPRHVLEVLRQPLEDQSITIARTQMTLSFPSSFVLVAAMNPCPCGYAGDPQRECLCTPAQIQRYMSRISGPLLDRIDIQVAVPRVQYRELREETPVESSASIRERIVRVRERQRSRLGNDGVLVNARMSPRQVERHCRLEPECSRLLERAVNRLGLSARGWNRVLKVSRTIADLEGIETIQTRHVAEAIQYRSLDRDQR